MPHPCARCGAAAIENTSDPRCATCARTPVEVLGRELIDRGIITAQRAFIGLTRTHVETIVQRGYGELPLLVHMRGAFDARRTMTAKQLLQAPAEVGELVRQVYIAGALRRIKS